MTATQAKPGRSREDLLQVAAALLELADSGRLGCSDSEAALRRRAAEVESEAMDAPPAADHVPDTVLVDVLMFAFGCGAATTLSVLGAPRPEAQAQALTVRSFRDPLGREEMLSGARHALAGRCSCGQDRGHEGHRHLAGGGGS